MEDGLKEAQMLSDCLEKKASDTSAQINRNVMNFCLYFVVFSYNDLVYNMPMFYIFSKKNRLINFVYQCITIA